MKIINLVLVITFLNLINNQSTDSIPNDEYKQAPIPPNIVVMQDMPQYGVKSLQKWEDYIHGNLRMINDFKLRKNRAHINLYKNRLSRISGNTSTFNILQLKTNLDPSVPTDS